MSNHNYMQQLIHQGQEKHGEKFDASDLDERFAPYYFSKERIKIRIEYLKGSDIITGTVGITTDWKPFFIFLRNIRSVSSSIPLTGDCHIISVKKKGDKKYSEIK